MTILETVQLIKRSGKVYVTFRSGEPLKFLELFSNHTTMLH